MKAFTTKHLLICTLGTLGCAGAALSLMATAPAQEAQEAQADPFSPDPREAFERQLERFSRMLPEDPGAREQFRKGMEELRKAFEEDRANPQLNGQPRTYEFRWEGDAGDLGQLREEFGRMGGLFGQDLFERFFGGGDSPFGTPQPRPRAFDLGDLLELAPEQEDVPELSKNHPEELAKFAPVVREATLSTVQLLSGGNQVALGTIVTADGYALTKRSELGPDPGLFEARLADGRSVAARFVESIPDYDLALLQLDATGLQPARFVEADLPLGSFLVASGITGEPVAFGVLSVLARNLSAERKGFLGIGVESAPDGNVVVRSVTPDSAAAAAGLQPDDVITEIDGKEVQSAMQLIKSISGREPDATIEISYLRDGRRSTTSARLRSRAELARMGFNLDPSAYDLTSRMGADLNRQRGGYPSAIQHDLPLKSNQMGGPLVDLDGNIVGINIARAGRINSFALPASAILGILDGLDLGNRSDRTAGESRHPEAPAPGGLALQDEVERAERAVAEARRMLQEAESSARRAREALERQQPR